MQSDSIQTRKKESMSLDNKAQVLSADTAMRIQGLSKEETLKFLNTSDKGLSAEEADRRLLEYGHNEIRR